MLQDVNLCKQLGFEGIVIGILNKNGTLDKERLKRFIDLAYPLEVTLHRAFDRTKDPFVALEDAIDCGFQRILTSGQQPNAFDAKELIKQLITQADDRIIIMPGSGVRSSNIVELSTYTGATELHSSARKLLPSSMEYVKETMNENLQSSSVDVEDIKKMKALLQ
jgi:copper homeostasis protein